MRVARGVHRPPQMMRHLLITSFVLAFTGCASSGDPNDCALGTAGCPPEATSTDLPQGYSCTCRQGFSGDGHLCADVDECALGTDNCDPRALCTNIAASFQCTCGPGYSGNGQTCNDVDECALQ